MILAVAALAVFASCSDKKASQSVVDKNSVSVVDNTASENANLDLASIAGTYEGKFPAADGPGIKTVLTIKADSTYQLKQDYVDQKDGHDEASGVFKVLDVNVLMLVRPSSGDNIFYKVRDGNCIILIDSFGNEPKKSG